MDSNQNISPVNPLPPVVVALVLAMFLVEAAFSLGARGLVGGAEAVGWRIAAVRSYAPSGFLVDVMWETGRYPTEHLLRFVTYPFIHGSFTHMLFAGVLTLALGNFVSEVFRPWAVLMVFFVSAIFGAVVYGFVIDSRVALIGAYPAVFGLVGAYSFLLWAGLAGQGAQRYRAFSLIGFLLFIQLVFGVFFGAGPDWIAKVAGFVCGFGLSFVVSPGGWSRVLDKIRNR